MILLLDIKIIFLQKKTKLFHGKEDFRNTLFPSTTEQAVY
jgi:hypothetical protein